MKLWLEIRRLLAQLRSHGLYLTLLAAIDKVVRWRTGHSAWRFGWITPNLLLGGQPARNVWAKLGLRGVTGVINLRHEYDYHNEIGDLPIRYLYLPTVDNTAPSQEHLWAGVKFIEEEVKKGGKVYIHCWEGLGRSPTMVAAYLVYTGSTPAEAWAKIRLVRPFIRPTETQLMRLDEFAVVVAERGGMKEAAEKEVAETVAQAASTSPS
ncbi:MAG: dual specificity protein phosphatase family protein [Anaerolineae bacterium]|nr:dual specificity protein phosphatase family protein [Anaerolineae bacterium]